VNEDRPTVSAAKCTSKIAVSSNIRFMQIFAGVRLTGASNESGVGFSAIFDQYVKTSPKRCILDTKLL